MLFLKSLSLASLLLSFVTVQPRFDGWGRMLLAKHRGFDSEVQLREEMWGLASPGAALAAQAAQAAQPTLEQRTIQLGGAEQSYSLYVPTQDTTAKPMPLIVLMHGAGGDGLGQVTVWRRLAAAKHIILLGPNIKGSAAAWDQLYDHPEWIHQAIEDVRKQYPVDSRRLYLSGYSAGGMFTFYFAFLESRYFAAAAVQAGVIENAKYQMADFAVRKIPLAYRIGTKDQWWSVGQARASRDALSSRGFPVQYVELPGADHNLYANPSRLVDDTWNFLAKHALESEPWFEPLDLPKIKATLK